MKKFFPAFSHLLFILTCLLAACEKAVPSDAFGNFEAEEIIISAEESGRLTEWQVEEGLLLKAGQYLGVIDTVPLHLQRRQISARIRATLAQQQDVATQLGAMREQRSSLASEIDRFTRLVADQAAPAKQLDDLNHQLDVLDKEILAKASALRVQNQTVRAAIAPLQAQIDLIEDRISRCVLSSPVDGTVLNVYIKAHEMAIAGRPLFSIADLRHMELRVYISGQQLPEIRPGQPVNVRIDAPGGGIRALPGRVSWIAGKAEFTPKNIQTRSERVDQVYAVKIIVDNDGYLKIGMPAEVVFSPSGNTSGQKAVAE